MLGLIAQSGRVPLSIGFERRRATLFIDITVDGLDGRARETLLHRMVNVVAVRFAELIDRAGQPIAVDSPQSP